MITTHHDGHGLTERIRIDHDGPGPGGAPHRYDFVFQHLDGPAEMVGFLRFQQGPVDAPGSKPGLVGVAVLAALAHQLECFQAGPYPSRETGEALEHILQAMAALRRRADERARRGVLGTEQR